MKKILLLLIVLTTIKSFSQQDSIINYINWRGKTVKNITEAKSIEILTKKSDSLWLERKFFRNGKVFMYTFYKTSNRKIPIGKSTRYFRNGKKSYEVSYNSLGDKQGKSTSWFRNGSLNSVGLFSQNKKNGSWKYYRVNGELASRVFYKNDDVLKVLVYTLGEKQTYNKLKPIVKPKFKGGKENFLKKVKKITRKLQFKVKGKIHISFFVDIDGSINDVHIVEELPKELHDYIVDHFKNIKGWTVGEDYYRKHPLFYSIPLNFQG